MKRLIENNLKILNRCRDRPLTDADILKFAQPLLNFRGVFMRNDFPSRCRKHECGVINLDDKDGIGTHWVAYYRKKNLCIYFDSFGNLQPPLEFFDYIGKNCTVCFNYKVFQRFDTVNCGHLCLQFLYAQYVKEFQ